MSEARITFEVEIDGVKERHTCYFGMTATQIIAEKSIKLSQSGEADPIKSFAYILYGGLCNNADMNDFDRPAFHEAYSLTEKVLSASVDIQNSIYSAWENSKPHQDLLKTFKALNKGKKKVDPKEAKIGTK